MEISKVTVADAEALLAIYAPYVRDTAVSFEYDVPTADEFSHRIAETSAKYPYIKATDGGEIVGYAYASAFKTRAAYARSVEISIYVKQGKHHRGIGKMLMNALEASLADMGILNMNACIATPKGEDEYLTDGSHRFHSAMGFRLVGRFDSCAYKFGRWYDMIWMEKHIGKHGGTPNEVKLGEWTI